MSSFAAPPSPCSTSPARRWRRAPRPTSSELAKTGVSIITIAHHAELAAFHTRELYLDGKGKPPSEAHGRRRAPNEYGQVRRECRRDAGRQAEDDGQLVRGGRGRGSRGVGGWRCRGGHRRPMGSPRAAGAHCGLWRDTVLCIGRRGEIHWVLSYSAWRTRRSSVDSRHSPQAKLCISTSPAESHSQSSHFLSPSHKSRRDHRRETESRFDHSN